ncbi:MAG: iron ABC transporter permease [Aeropyrum sp.]|nr:iron ABC transporter permease [Aeropyrum sp.]
MKARLRFFIVLSSLTIIALASLALGPAGLRTPLDYLDGIDGVERYRLLRTLAAAVVGVSLALGGGVLQQSLRNPLVDPYLLGISTGASLSVAIGLLLGLAGPLEMGFLAIVGGLASYSLVIATAGLAGFTGSSLIIVGVAYSYLFSSVTTLLVISFPDKLQGSLYWIFGSAAYIDREVLSLAVISALAALAVVVIRLNALEALSLGEEAAEGLGVDVRRLRLDSVTFSLMAVATAVALAGPVGFVGLTAPWIARLLGSTRFSQLAVYSIPLGAGLVLLSDVIARTAASPSELPLTPVTSLLGVPVLVYATLERWKRLEAL